MTTLPNGLTVVLLARSLDADRARRALVSRRVEEREAGAHRLRAPVRAHDVQGLEERRARRARRRCIASVGGQSNAYTTDDETVFWQTVPAQYLPLVLWLEADRMATLRIDKTTFANEREVVKEERRMRVDNQPFGRLHGDPLRPRVHGASRTSTRRSAAWRTSRRRRSRTCATSTRRSTCRSNATMAIVGDFDTAQAQGAGDEVLRPRAEVRSRRCRATSREEPPHGQGAPRHGRTKPGRCRPSSSRIHITYDGHPDSYPLHIASKILSDGQSSRIYQSAGLREAASRCRRSAAATHRGSEPVLRRGASSQPGHDARRGREGADRRARPAASASRSAERELQRTKNQFARDYILGRESIQQKASQLAHAVVIHDDVTTADGEFEIFQSITVGRRAARREDLLHAGEPPRADDLPSAAQQGLR